MQYRRIHEEYEYVQNLHLDNALLVSESVSRRKVETAEVYFVRLASGSCTCRSYEPSDNTKCVIKDALRAGSQDHKCKCHNRISRTGPSTLTQIFFDEAMKP
jgi:hypothetical protein